MTNRELIGLVIVITPGLVLAIGVVAFLLYDAPLVGLSVFGVLMVAAYVGYLLGIPEKHK